MDIKKMRAIHKKATFLPWKYRGDNADYIWSVKCRRLNHERPR